MPPVKKVPVVVTTAHRGVFYGVGIPSDAETITITDARMCVYWSQDVRGVLGLASSGPSKNCKVTLPVPSLTLRDVTAVIVCSQEAAEAWGRGPWA